MPRRDLSRRSRTGPEIDAASKIHQSDIDHAASTWRTDAPRSWRGRLDATPTYIGEGLPSDTERDP